jgi:hypothetical protein
MYLFASLDTVTLGRRMHRFANSIGGFLLISEDPSSVCVTDKLTTIAYWCNKAVAAHELGALARGC